MTKVKPLQMFGRKPISVKLEPAIIELLEARVAEERHKQFSEDSLQHARLGWDRSSYLRRLIIEHLDIELEDF